MSGITITGMKHSDFGSNPLKVEITSGGIGSNHVSMTVTSKDKGQMNSMFEIFGKKQ